MTAVYGASARAQTAAFGLYPVVMSDERMPPRESDDPRERDLSRRSNNPSVSIWLILMAIGLLGAVVYVASAVL
jgi:hypothetical protein